MPHSRITDTGGGLKRVVWKNKEKLVEIHLRKGKETPEDKVGLLQEAAILSQFKHPNIIGYYGILVDGLQVSRACSYNYRDYPCVTYCNSKELVLYKDVYTVCLHFSIQLTSTSGCGYSTHFHQWKHVVKLNSGVCLCVL